MNLQTIAQQEMIFAKIKNLLKDKEAWEEVIEKPEKFVVSTKGGEYRYHTLPHPNHDFLIRLAKSELQLVNTSLKSLGYKE